MTDTMLRTPQLKNLHKGTKHFTLRLSIKQKHCFSTLIFCQGFSWLKYTHKQNRHSNNLTCMLNPTLFVTKSLACKFFISTIQTLNLSLHCTYSKLCCSMEVNRVKELLIHIFQGASNTDGMYLMRQTALQVYVILMWHVDMFSG